MAAESWNSSDMDETVYAEVFEVAYFEYEIKIYKNFKTILVGNAMLCNVD